MGRLLTNGPISKFQRLICYELSWEAGVGPPKEPAPTPICAGWRWVGGVGRLKVGGARLLFALHPPPFPIAWRAVGWAGASLRAGRAPATGFAL